MNPIKGRAHCFGADVNTDVIIPARYLTTTDPSELAKHCMEAVDPDFPGRVQPGDIMVAGANFGSGSSREHAPVAIKGCGIACVVASGFARIFYRNAINVGLPIIECPDIVKLTEDGDELEIDLAAGKVNNITKGASAGSQPFPDFMQVLLEAGGLVPYLKTQLHAKGAIGSGAPAAIPEEADLSHD